MKGFDFMNKNILTIRTIKITDFKTKITQVIFMVHLFCNHLEKYINNNLIFKEQFLKG